MSTYPKSTLGRMLNFYNGKAIKPGGKGQYPAYGSNGLIGGCDEFKYSDGIIIGRVGAYCGSVQYCTGNFWASDNTIVVKPQNADFDVRFLFYLLSDLNLNNYAGGAAQPLVTQTVLKQVEAYSPPLKTQRKIAAVLSAYDDLIENNTRRIKILEEMAQALYREWFVNFRFPGHEQVRMVDSSLGRVPEGWEVGRLDDALVLQRGFDLPKGQRSNSGEVPIFAATGHNGTHNVAKVKAPGILTGRSGSLGTVQYIDEDFWPLNTTLWVKEFKRATPLFAFYLLSGLELQKFNSGAAVPTLNRNDVHGLPTLLPPASVLELFDKHILPMFGLKKALSNKNQNLSQARDLLLPKLVAGELDVSELAD